METLKETDSRADNQETISRPDDPRQETHLKQESLGFGPSAGRLAGAARTPMEALWRARLRRRERGCRVEFRCAPCLHLGALLRSSRQDPFAGIQGVLTPLTAGSPSRRRRPCPPEVSAVPCRSCLCYPLLPVTRHLPFLPPGDDNVLGREQAGRRGEQRGDRVDDAGGGRFVARYAAIDADAE